MKNAKKLLTSVGLSDIISMSTKKGQGVVVMIEYFELGKLYDFYKELLTDRQREALDLYYNDDLTMIEIAEELGISKQAVSTNIKNGVSNLEKFEENLKLARNFYIIESAKDKLENLYNNSVKKKDLPTDVEEEIFAILSMLDEI